MSLAFDAAQVATYMKKSKNKSTYIADGIMFTRNGGTLIMEFKTGGMVRRLKVDWQNARKMAEVMQELFLKDN